MSFGFVLDNFAVDSDELTRAHKAQLDKMLGSMVLLIPFSKSEFWLITLVGSASRTGTDAYNLALSKRRAEAVRKYIAPKLAGARVRIRIVAIGESGPHDKKIMENAKDRSVGVSAILTGRVPPPPPPPPPPPKRRIPMQEEFNLKVISFLTQSLGIGIPWTPVDVHIARIAMNFTIDDGRCIQKYTFLGEGGGSSASNFFAGGERSRRQGKDQKFNSWRDNDCDDFAGRGELSVVTGQFMFGGKTGGIGRFKYPMATISKFEFPPSFPGMPGKEGFNGVILRGFKPLVPEFPKSIPPGGVF